MDVNNIDISKLPADVRKQYKTLQVMHAEKKIQNKEFNKIKKILINKDIHHISKLDNKIVVDFK